MSAEGGPAGTPCMGRGSNFTPMTSYVAKFGSFFFFFQSTAPLQYVEDSEPVTRSTLVNSAKTELQVQKE